MHSCPNCTDGKVTAFVNRGPDIDTHSIETFPCATCGGTAKIDDELAGWIIKGKAARDARVVRRESLLEAANRMGITPGELSQIERGHGPAVCYNSGDVEAWAIQEGARRSAVLQKASN